MALSNLVKNWPIFKNLPKMSKRLPFRDFIAFAYTNFLYGESKNLRYVVHKVSLVQTVHKVSVAQ